MQTLNLNLYVFFSGMFDININIYILKFIPLIFVRG